MIRVFVTYGNEPDAARYAQHEALCRSVPGATFRHGKVTRTLFGEPTLSYYAELEFPDRAAYETAASGPELAETGKDAARMAIQHAVYVADLD